MSIKKAFSIVIISFALLLTFSYVLATFTVNLMNDSKAEKIADTEPKKDIKNNYQTNAYEFADTCTLSYVQCND